MRDLKRILWGNAYENMVLDENMFLDEGDKVCLNVVAMKSDGNWNKKSGLFHKFVETHKDNVFTVKFDRRYCAKSPLVCLEEDKYNFLWFIGHLIKVSDQ